MTPDGKNVLKIEDLSANILDQEEKRIEKKNGVKLSFAWSKKTSSKRKRNHRMKENRSSSTADLKKEFKKARKLPERFTTPIHTPANPPLSWKEASTKALTLRYQLEDKHNIMDEDATAYGDNRSLEAFLALLQQREYPKAPTSAHQLQVSLVICLYKDGFVCRDNIQSRGKKEQIAQPYSRASRVFLQSIDMGMIPIDLTDHVPCTFYNGTIVAEIKDYRKLGTCVPTTLIECTTNDSLNPRVRRVLLRSSNESCIQDMSNIAASHRKKHNLMTASSTNMLLEAEQKLLNYIVPSNGIVLSPSPDLFHMQTYLYSNGPQRYSSIRYCQPHHYRRLEHIYNTKLLGPTRKHHQRTSASSSTSTSSSTAAGGSSSSTKRKRASVTSTSSTTSAGTSGSKKSTASSSKAKGNTVKGNNSATGSSKSKTTSKKTKKATATTLSEQAASKRKSQSVSSHQSTNDDHWDFITSLLDSTDTSGVPLPLDLSTTPSSSNQGNPKLIRNPTSNHHQLMNHHYATKSAQNNKMPKSFNPCDVSNPIWFNAAERVQKELTRRFKQSLGHMTNVQSLAMDGAGRAGSIRILGSQLGKTLWPTESIAHSKAKERHRQAAGILESPSPRSRVTTTTAGLVSNLRGAALREAQARGLS